MPKDSTIVAIITVYYLMGATHRAFFQSFHIQTHRWAVDLRIPRDKLVFRLHDFFVDGYVYPVSRIHFSVCQTREQK